MEENNEVRAVFDMRVPGKRPRGDQEGDGWIMSDGICRHCGSPQRMPRTEHSGNQEFGPLTPPSGKRRKKKKIHVETLAAEDDCEHLTFNVGVSLFAITKGLAGEPDGLPVLDENGAESSAGGVDLDDTLSLWVEVCKGHFATDERLRRCKYCVVRVCPNELGVILH